MKILANRNVKVLFGRAAGIILVAALFSAVIIQTYPESSILYIPGLILAAGIALMAVMYLYFREQNRIMEGAVTRIRDYIGGNRDARIQCDEEGELYRLFHEVNSLAAILNAHAENEEKAKIFMKDTISDISHQLKTPLAALNIYNGILQGEAENLPAVREFTDLSEQELDRIETLVQNLLKITKLDAGTIVIEKNLENVSEMMEDIEKHFAYRAEREGKKLTLSGDETTSMQCDRTWLTEAVSNIIKNAFDHTEKGDTVSVTWRQTASLVQIVVKDTGSGIHPEDLNHIFKRFYRSRFSKDTQGIGLGLPLAKAVVEAHSGTIEVESRLGEGTVFTMDFLSTV
ncbi:HAMP domain-containing histidine kinase [Mediterraneibacter glycyrrhizinilyticus]|nr:HAMP domain-containing histidine kinase [Mediterraneibacter glycyrrhizinilyticus]